MKRKKSTLTGVGRAFLGCRSSLQRYIARFIHQPQDIEDIVHETFLRTYAAEIKTQIHSPKAFLFRTAKNLSLKHLSKCSYKLTDYLEDLDLPAVLIDEVSVESRVEAQERFAVFCRAVRKLPSQCRRVYILRKVYGLTHKEIADHLGISTNTVEKHLATGILRCNEFMRISGFAPVDTLASKKMKIR